MGQKFLFTSESVTEGHPDKIADQISDAILDEIIRQDPDGRVACETLVTRGLIFVAGEITTDCYVDIPALVRRLVMDVGYTNTKDAFNGDTCGVIIAIQEQSPDIAIGVDKGGAGDQGMMFGYACRETEELMPLPIMLAHKLAMRLAEARKLNMLDYLRPDGKSQVTVEYEDGVPKRVDTVVIAAQHEEHVSLDKLRGEIKEVIAAPVLEGWIDKNTKYHINATGKFVIGGPQADTGVTGRKIMVDTYGGMAPHGGGCFSGKDPTKVDRSASYMARYIAKNVVAAGIADKFLIQLSYVIGEQEPVSIMIDTFGTGKIAPEKIEELIRAHFNLTPWGIIEQLKLLRPIYRKTAVYGHFGRNDKDFTWEATDKAEILRQEAGLD